MIPAAPRSATGLIDLARSRAGEFDLLGAMLYRILRKHKNSLDFLLVPFPAQLSALEFRRSELSFLDPLLPAAISLLLFKFPLQLPDDASLVTALARAALTGAAFSRSHPPPPRTAVCAPKSYPALVTTVINNAEFRDSLFPHKPHPAAQSKPSVRLAALVRAYTTLAPPAEVGRLLSLLPVGTPRDVAVSHLLYTFALLPHFQSSSGNLSASLLRHPKRAKGLSNALKALGLNSTPVGAVLTESQTLQGRLVGGIDWDNEISRRCDPALVRPYLVSLTADELRPHVAAILDLEIPKGFTLPDLDSFWSSRWLWCVNGAHTSESSRALGIPPDSFPGFSRTYRRMAAEYVETEPITGWDGVTTVSASEKLEHGKTRAIFACDTLSYFAWSWPLNAVQSAWKNRRVLLDPGAGGTVSLASRIGTATARPGVNLMLDFDDFNSHHSTEVMQMVTDELLNRCDCPPFLRETLIRSLDSEYIVRAGQRHHVAGTLMSGHRGTTFFNSVLNAAYIRAAAGADLYDRIFSLHTGDDVYARVPTTHEVEKILDGAAEIGCRLNPTKQSIGHTRAEFLRCAFGPSGAYGYVARSIATIASGNWTSSAPLPPQELLTHFMGVTRSIINRSGQKLFPRLLAPALRLPRGIGVRSAIEMLAGNTAALDNSPVYDTPVPFPRFRLVDESAERPDPPPPTLPSRATRDYLTTHVGEVELVALSLAKVDPTPLMIASSYNKGQVVSSSVPSSPRLKRIGDYKPRNPGFATGQVSQLHVHGVLNRYPLLRLVEDRLTTGDLEHLLRLEGYAPGPDPRVTAFGSKAHPVLVSGVIPFSDAASISRATGYDHVRVLYPIAM